jgi:CubicO group peptidase (beta-lactamase class C family)
MVIKLKDIFVERYDESTPGLGVIANKKGKIVYEQTIGLANCEHKVPIDLNTVFNLASLSKQFTGMAVLQLIERGELCPLCSAVIIIEDFLIHEIRGYFKQQ